LSDIVPVEPLWVEPVDSSTAPLPVKPEAEYSRAAPLTSELLEPDDTATLAPASLDGPTERITLA
jgi:hypothetical protein